LIDENVNNKEVEYSFKIHPRAHEVFNSDAVRNKKVLHRHNSIGSYRCSRRPTEDRQVIPFQPVAEEDDWVRHWAHYDALHEGFVDLGIAD
jgi:hypothetical protein